MNTSGVELLRAYVEYVLSVQNAEAATRGDNLKAYELGLRYAESEAERRASREAYYKRESDTDTKTFAGYAIGTLGFLGIGYVLKCTV